MGADAQRAAVEMVCGGCGLHVDPARTLPFRCPSAARDAGIDHVLARRVPIDELDADAAGFGAADAERNPFVRFRRLTLAWHVAMAHGLDDDAYVALVRELDDAVARVDGSGFRATPLAHHDALGAWVKDETGNVSGSHKARHLMGVMLALRVFEVTGLHADAELRSRPLAIASCGNAALAAAVVARAAEWPIDVYIPLDASEAVVRRLGDLGARIHVCQREAGAAGDPCVTAFRAAVSGGAIPFGVQGSESGLCVEGGHTLGWELAAQFAAQLAGAAAGDAGLDAIYVQVGGGALAAGLYRGLREARALGVLRRLPRLYTVQTEGAWPLRRAWDRWREAGVDLAAALRDRGSFMWPWETEPRSIAHGILDDETYEWATLLDAMDESGGEPLVVDEDTLREANRVGCAAIGIAVSHTGTAGLAGVLAKRAPGRIGVVFTGAER